LLARQSLERAIIRTQSMDAIAELLVFVQEQRDSPAELGLLAGERLQMQQPSATEDHGRYQCGRHDGGESKGDALA